MWKYTSSSIFDITEGLEVLKNIRSGSPGLKQLWEDLYCSEASSSSVFYFLRIHNVTRNHLGLLHLHRQ